MRHKPIEIRMAGYGPPSTSFSQALKLVGDRLESAHPDAVEIRYVWNIMDLGYKAEDILWLVESGVLTLGYQSTSYFTSRVPDLAILDLPFLFADNATARQAMDGAIGSIFRNKIEQAMNYRILGYFENGFRHVSNRIRPIRSPADMKGLRIRVLPSEIQARTFQLLGAQPMIMDLTEAREGIADGTLEAQENPFANTVTYGVHGYHKHHTLTSHSYLSRPIFVHRPSFDAWPPDLQSSMRDAVAEAVAMQRKLGEQEAVSARVAIEAAGGTVVELTPAQHRAFVDAVALLFDEAAEKYDSSVIAMLADKQRPGPGSQT